MLFPIMFPFWLSFLFSANISWDEKFKLDIEYVDKHNFLLDMKIVFLTLKKIFIREGITQEGNATMEEFLGSE